MVMSPATVYQIPLIDINGRLSPIDWKPMLQQGDYLQDLSVMLGFISYLESGITNFIFFSYSSLMT